MTSAMASAACSLQYTPSLIPLILKLGPFVQDLYETPLVFDVHHAVVGVFLGVLRAIVLPSQFQLCQVVQEPCKHRMPTSFAPTTPFSVRSLQHVSAASVP